MQHEHDCQGCISLGEFKNFDLYFHPIGTQTLIARFGSDGDYMSGLHISTSEPLIEARKRAIEQGLVPADIEIPDLDEHSTSWVVLYKKTGKWHGSFSKRESMAHLSSELHVVLTRHQYLLRVNKHAIAQSGAKDLLDQINRNGLSAEHGYPALVSALLAFIE